MVPFRRVWLVPVALIFGGIGAIPFRARAQTAFGAEGLTPAGSSGYVVTAAAEASERALRGQAISVDGVRPSGLQGVVRAIRAPIVVHGSDDTPAEILWAVRDAAVRALNVFEREYRFPLPAPDGLRGGGPDLDLYLVPIGRPSDTVIDALEYGNGWDRASAFILVRKDLSGGVLSRAVAEGIAHAILLGIDVRSPRSWRMALSSALAARALGLGPDLGAVAQFQRDPGAALIAGRDDTTARGAALWVDFIAARYDRADLPLLRGLTWMPVAQTPGRRPRLLDEPDVFDVMTRLFRDQRGGFEGMLAEFAVARALTGTEGDEMPIVGWADDPALGPDVTRTVEYEQLPTSVAPAKMLDETGVAYVRVNTQQARTGGMHLWFHGVPWRRWTVTLALLDANGRDIGRGPAGAVIKGEWSTTIQDLSGVHGVLIVVSDLGDGDYDPEGLPDRNGFFKLHLQRR